MRANKNNPVSMALDHFEGYELEQEYRILCDKLRFHKLDTIDRYAQQIINIFETYIDAKFLVSRQYIRVSTLYKKMRMTSFFYMAKDVRKAITLINPKYENTFSTRNCIRTLRYIGDSNTHVTYENFYESITFNGWFYTIIDNKGSEYSLWFTDCERLS